MKEGTKTWLGAYGTAAFWIAAFFVGVFGYQLAARVSNRILDSAGRK